MCSRALKKIYSKLKIKSLEDYIEESKGAPQIIDKIKETMAIKGFLSDKEFSELKKS